MGKLILRKLGEAIRRRTGLVRWQTVLQCNVFKAPSPICQQQYPVDTPTNLGGNIYGGDAFGLGEPGCPSVRHEVIVLAAAPFAPPPAVPVPITVVDSWNQTVLTSVFVSRTITVSSALHAFLGNPQIINIWLRSYTPGDFSYREDFCQTFVP